MRQYGGKRWVWVKLWDNDACTWIPSFEDLFRIIQAVCHCEDEKYPRGEGRGMVRRILHDCCESDASWELLKQKYQIPTRE